MGQPSALHWQEARADECPNALIYRDNLDVLRRHIADESVDLVYLDPPFNSDANHNVLVGGKGAGPTLAGIPYPTFLSENNRNPDYRVGVEVGVLVGGGLGGLIVTCGGTLVWRTAHGGISAFPRPIGSCVAVA